MALEVETKDCSALGDSEVSELADLCMDGQAGYDVGYLSKQREEWVLATLVREGRKLRAFSLVTLERIGGTPAVILGLVAITRTAKADSALRAVMGEAYRRALLAFPDEDVLVGARLASAQGFQVFSGLQDIVPRPGYKPTGEERAWVRRLARRFGAEARLDDRRSILAGDGSLFGCVDFRSAKAEARFEGELSVLFESLDTKKGDCLVAFGWAMADDLAAGRLG